MSCGVYEIIDVLLYDVKLIDSKQHYICTSYMKTTNRSVCFFLCYCCCCLQIIMLVEFIGGMRNNNNNSNTNNNNNNKKKKRITCNVCVDERIIRKMKVQGQKLSFLCCYCSVSYFFYFFLSSYASSTYVITSLTAFLFNNQDYIYVRSTIVMGIHILYTYLCIMFWAWFSIFSSSFIHSLCFFVLIHLFSDAYSSEETKKKEK